jgi:hypothetical protein
MTTPSPRRCSVPPNIGRSSRSRGLPIWRPPENGAPASCNGTTTNTVIVVSVTSPLHSDMSGRMAQCSPPCGLPECAATQSATLEWADPQLDTSGRGHPQPGARCYNSGGHLTNPAFRFDRRTCFPAPTWQRPSHGAQRRRWEEQSHPQPRAARPVAREHGEAGEHRTFSAVSTVAHSSPVGGSHLQTSAPQAQQLRR